MNSNNFTRFFFRNLGLSLILFLSLLFTQNAKAQYFGQNKVRYEKLPFKVYKSPHFEFYYYLTDSTVLQKIVQDAEIWYKMHQEVFKDTLKTNNPIIVYKNHSDFQQTTAIDGNISVGTGGVTEALKNRVVFPILNLRSQTRHVLGHELVHAFQYHKILEGTDSAGLQNLSNTPLWMVEGMAEYFSLGKKDPFTAMWMRDAMLNKDIPSLKDLSNNNRYFPYRYGQAFWAYIGSVYGDTTIVPLLQRTAKHGYENAIRLTFGFSDRTLSGLWQSAIERSYRPLLKADSSQIKLIGNKIIDNVNGGNMNLAPAISPNGKYVAYLSEQDLFGIDLYLADAKTGKTIKKLSSVVNSQHIDDFNFIESAGAWSPDNEKFAFSVFAKGKNQLVIIDINKAKTILQTEIPGVEQFSNLTWSPNGHLIAFSALVNGQSDIYTYDINTKKVENLTNDVYSDYAPSFSPDGESIVFSTDRVADTENSLEAYLPMNMAILNLKTKNIQNIPVFKGANNLNPLFTADGKNIVFLSNRDGFRNLYEYQLADNKVSQLTNYFTGISGITEFSPAISISKQNEIVYSYYRYQRYTLYNANLNEFKANVVDANDVNFQAGILPTSNTSAAVNIVNPNLTIFNRFEQFINGKGENVPYKPKFQLDYLQNSGTGASYTPFGPGITGGIMGQFSDILGRNQLFANLAVNGQIYDFGGIFSYLNQAGRIYYGASISHIPYMSGLTTISRDKLNDGNEYINYRQDIIRNFSESVQALAAYPFNKFHRFQVSGSLSYNSYRIDRFNNYIDPYSYYTVGTKYERNINKKQAEESYRQAGYGYNLQNLRLYQTGFSFIGDNAITGIAAPLDGFRYIISASQTGGTINFTNINVDLRRYVRFKPVTVAARFLTFSRFGKDADRIFGNYIGNPFLIRGYEINSFYRKEGSSNFDINQLVGSKSAVANFELRLPFTGPKKLAQIQSKMILTDLNLFFDIGLAWNNNSIITFNQNDLDKNSDNLNIAIPNAVTSQTTSNTGVYRTPAMSLGASLRVNVFNYLILEPYFAIPFQRKLTGSFGVFGLNFAPGW